MIVDNFKLSKKANKILLLNKIKINLKNMIIKILKLKKIV